MLNNSAIIAYSTTNFKVLSDHFLSSCQKNNIPDKNIFIQYEDITLNHTESSFGHDKWYNCLVNKLLYIIDTIKLLKSNIEYKYFIVSDCDVWFISSNRSEWYNLEKFLESHDADIFFMPEFVGKDMANGGFYIIKNNNNVLKITNFFSSISSIMKNTDSKQLKYGDQTLINQYKSSINYNYIPKEYMIWGPIIADRKKAIIHHAVCAPNIKRKLLLIQNIKNQFNLL